MTAQRLPSYTPPAESARYRVKVMRDRHDPDQDYFYVTVRALGVVSAREIAVDSVRDRYPSACALSAEEIVADPKLAQLCPHCVYSFAIHDNSDPRSLMPWGCPPDEHVAVERWGRAG